MKFKVEKLERELKNLIALNVTWVHPNVEWKQEVNAGDTILGYEDWLKARVSQAKSK